MNGQGGLELRYDTDIVELWRKQVGIYYVPGYRPENHGQRTVELGQKTAEIMLPYLKDQEIEEVIDLGCGSGYISICFDKLGKWSPHYWLVDGNVAGDVTKMKKHWGHYPGGTGLKPYNQLDLTEKLCHLNDFCDYHLVRLRDPDGKLTWEYPDRQTEERAVNKKADLLYSCWAVCFHFPLEPHLPYLARMLRPGATCFFGSSLEKPNQFPPQLELVDVQRWDWGGKWMTTMVCRYRGDAT